MYNFLFLSLGRSLTESSVDYENVMIRNQSVLSEGLNSATQRVVEVTGPREVQRQQLFQKHGTARSCRRSLVSLQTKFKSERTTVLRTENVFDKQGLASM